MSTIDISTMIAWMQNIENTNQYVPLCGYLVMYDRGAFVFGKVEYVSAVNWLLDLPLNFLMKFCVNHDVDLARRFQIPIRSLEVGIKGRGNDPAELLMSMTVNNLSKMRKKKKMLKGLSYLLIGFDSRLETYEEYYKELLTLEKQKAGKRYDTRANQPGIRTEEK